jgi:thiamine-monophosphate kinase
MRPSEDDIIARYLAPLAGPGGFGLRDDAALATPRAGHDLVVTKDMLVAGVHFFPDDPPDAIARKALRVNLSDLAAKGAAPIGFLLGLALPSDWTEPWLRGFTAGLGDDARVFACPLLGGDTVATPGPLTLSVTAFGEVEVGRMVPRVGARAGDRIYVTGTIGDAALGLQVRRSEEQDIAWREALGPAAADALLARHLMPIPRLGLRAALRAYARAAMDVSDGFVGDLGKMLRSEGLTTSIAARDVPFSQAVRAAIRFEPRLLMTALTGGDDYEVLCAVAPDHAEPFEARAMADGVPVRWVASAAVGSTPVLVRDFADQTLELSCPSFQHFNDDSA